MAGYDYYGANAQAQQGASGPPTLATTNRDALLYLLNQNKPITSLVPPNDFPSLGSPVPQSAAPSAAAPASTPASPTSNPASFNPSSPLSSLVTTPSKYAQINFAPRGNRAAQGVVPSTDPANWNAAPGGVTDPAKFAATNFDALGNRDFLNKEQGGSFWSDTLGPPPHGYVYNANGGLMKESGWDKFQRGMETVTQAGLVGGIGSAVMAPAIGSAIVDAATSANVPRDQMGNPYVAGRAGDASGGAGPSTATTGTPTTPPASVAAATLPDNVDTNGYAKPGYIAPTPAAQAMPGWDQTKWNDPAHQSPKYVVGRILSQYSQDAAGLKQAMPDIIKAYPGATQTGEDTITIPGVGTDIDVLKAGGGWWWGPDASGGGGNASSGGGGGTDLSAGYNALGDLSTSDVIARIIRSLGGMAGGEGSASTGPLSLRDVLLNQFGAQ